MTDATDLWAAVVTSYDSDGLITLTNIRDRSATTVNTTAGEDAAQAVVNLWSMYAQEDYDASDAQQVEVAKRGVIAMLWERGGSSAQVAKVEWQEVFSPEGLIARVRKTGPRGRQGPTSNSGVQQKSELSNGRKVRGWSDRDSLPTGWMPRRTVVDD